MSAGAQAPRPAAHFPTYRTSSRYERARTRRWSGGGLAAFIAVLIVSGFALLCLTGDEWIHYSAVSHEVFGVAVSLVAFRHWIYRRRHG